MSILTTNPETPSQAAARRLVEGIQSTKRAILAELRHNVGILWDDADPQAVLDALGPQAGQVFALNTAFGTFIYGMLAEAGDAEGLAELQRILAKVKPSTIHEDGTVTIDPEPEPEEEPELEEEPAQEEPEE